MPSTDPAGPTIEQRLEDLLARVEGLEAENLLLRGAAANAPGNERVAVAPVDRPTGPLSRRRMLKTSGGVAAAGVGLALAGGALHPEAASAAAGGTFILGQVNFADTATTTLGTAIGNGNPAFVVDNVGSGDGTQSTSQNLAGVHGFSGGGGGSVGNGGVGVLGESTDGNGVRALSVTGVGMWAQSTSGAGLLGHSQSWAGGYFKSDSGPQLVLQPTRGAPTTDSTAHELGEMMHDLSGNLWFCSANGTPGTWRKVSGAGTAGALHVLPAPVRVYDSRFGSSPAIGSKTPLVGGTARTLDLTVNSSTVPPGATAAMVTCLLVNTVSGAGNFTIWANGVARSLANNMVWGGTAGRFSSPAVTALDATGQCQVMSSIKTDFVLDVIGYYR